MTSSIVLIYSDYSVTFVFSTGKENTTWFVSKIGVDIGTSKNGKDNFKSQEHSVID